MGDWLDESRALGRRTGTVVTAEEVAAMNGQGLRYERRVLLDYDLCEGGRVPPPERIEVMCRPEDAEGVARTMSRLLESRGWSARVERRITSVAPRARREGTDYGG